MKKILFLFPLLLFLGCASGGKMMTMESYSDLPVGISSDELVKERGDPYTVTRSGENEIYEYIERISAFDRVIMIRHYFFTVRDGRIIEKQVKEEKPYVFRDSYELQTSLNGEEE